MYSLKDKVAIVTGGANGIGASIVREFIKEKIKGSALLQSDLLAGDDAAKGGARLPRRCLFTLDLKTPILKEEKKTKAGRAFHILAVRISKPLSIIDVVEDAGIALESELRTKCGERVAVHFFKCDVTKAEQLYDVFNKVIEVHGRIDIVVNNAGLADESSDRYRLQIEVNFTAIVASSFKALELMRVDRGGKGGTIINVSSIVALSHEIGLLPVYAGTKSAILQFSCRLGMEELYSRTNVRVLTMCFGATDTNILKTCKSFEEKTTEIIREYFSTSEAQSSEAAARGVVQSYKTGKSGSAWLIDKNSALDITDKIKKANEIMSADVTV